MKTCTFIGHRSISNEIEPILKSILTDLILNNNVKNFYVGNNGGFDWLVKKALENLQKQYCDIEYKTVLAYLPTEKKDYEDYSNTVYPEGLEKVPKRYAIIERNKWMIIRADFVVCYVENPFSNSCKFKEFAERKGKVVLNIFDRLN